MFSSVLIANRGEIAVRIIRAARALGMRTIAVYSQADTGALHAEMADEAHEIGPAPAAQSYLSIANILAAARQAKAECIHPGYGFLSENADFAESCAAAGLVFVGPPPAAIRAMGRKDEAKALMQAAGVPVVPGYHGEKQDAAFLKEKAYEIGYPVLIKAVAGGGGRGMRQVTKHGEFAAALEAARREAAAGFGDDRVLLEKYVEAPRHIEVQVLGDAQGNYLHLFERDCSLQRRHQKLIEEAPAPGMSEGLRAAMTRAALKAAEAVGYRGAGTVEFIVDGSAAKGGGLEGAPFYFLEMNTRLQVEHPVSEEITGIDLVAAQFRIAAGESLTFGQKDIAIGGHAVEARIYAEDPERDFLPSSGRIEALELPTGQGLRVECGNCAGDDISPYYDALIAKVVAHGASRGQALDRLAAALRGTLIAGVHTNSAFLAALADDAEFRAGKFDTGLVARRLPGLAAMDEALRHAVAALGAMHLLGREAQARRSTTETIAPAWRQSDGWQLFGAREQTLDVTVDGDPVRIELDWDGGTASVCLDGGRKDWPELEAALIDAGKGVYVVSGGRSSFVARADHGALADAPQDDDASVRAPMHGRVIALAVEPGQAVARGDALCTVEAMKMEHALRAGFAGVVSEVRTAIGDQVSEGDVLVVVRAAGKTA